MWTLSGGCAGCGGGCGGGASETSGGDAASPWQDHTRRPTRDRPRRPARDRVFAHVASRCGECHGATETEWAGSAHARAATSPGYLAMRARSGPAAPDCAPCHQPLAAHARDGDPVLVAAAAEGVTCDVCHTIAAVELGELGGTYTMRLASRARYGPLCDTEDHYFHTMACSPLHQRAEFCGPCHQLVLSSGPAGPMPVYTTYTEWRQSPDAAGGVTCQDCHMPGRRGEVAVGAGERGGVSEHGLVDSALLGRAAALAVRIGRDSASGALRIDYDIHNSGAGHSLPTGLPARRLLLRARARDPGGRVTGQVSVSFGRVLVDGAGRVAPFVRAARQAEDTRIAAGERRIGHLYLAPEGQPDAIDFELAVQSYAPEIAAELGLGAPAERVLLRARRPVPRPGAAPGPWIEVRP